MPFEPAAFGLIAIGDELLSGRRTDKHLAHFKDLLGQRGHSLAWHWVLPDEPPVLIAHLRFSMSRTDPVLVCGGIGATPDDHTRACVAEAAGVALERHPEALALIEGRFGAAAYPERARMADLPLGCGLIPNSYNQIPGFSLGSHYCLPGFPEMAWPMAQWVLDTHFPGTATGVRELSLRVYGVSESRIVPLMRCLTDRFPDLKLFSLPHIGDEPHVILGFRGRRDLEPAMAALRSELAAEGIDFEPAESGGEAT